MCAAGILRTAARRTEPLVMILRQNALDLAPQVGHVSNSIGRKLDLFELILALVVQSVICRIMVAVQAGCSGGMRLELGVFRTWRRGS
jgi:hypothetical protein